MSPDPFGRAIRDHYLGERDHPLIDRDGDRRRDHPIEAFYFEDVTGEAEGNRWAEFHLAGGDGPAPGGDGGSGDGGRWRDGDRGPGREHRGAGGDPPELAGPLLEMGAGAGRHALYFQERVEAVACEVSEHLVETMRDRGVEDAREVDMFALRAAFERDRFRSAFARGTQVGLAGSMAGLRSWLSDLAHVTTPDARAVFDLYDPGHERASDLLGYRPDPTPGLAFRSYHSEYEGEVGETLLFRLFSPDRVRAATVGTDWSVVDTYRGSVRTPHYQVALSKG